MISKVLILASLAGGAVYVATQGGAAEKVEEPTQPRVRFLQSVPSKKEIAAAIPAAPSFIFNAPSMPSQQAPKKQSSGGGSRGGYSVSNELLSAAKQVRIAGNLERYHGSQAPKKQTKQVETAIASGTETWGKFGVYTPETGAP